ncbi:M20/M25/M40 family metallo-hydrolase [Sphingomonas piscis]|uniref:M20/M25/M40 family metallo-hydrolase n=1 Tax=Sphingomonas piscis TaxID=2714943 RepID=A0A6G7YQG8_9SPHN|nr:M28 family metallopeptidase [Sphingomonas piscis]QIK78983.1 M20/M25/M40 family metallo-hydrolase [Sphingomonas piscis]
MRKLHLLLLGVCAVPGAASAQTFSPERIKADVAFLADDLLEGRNAGERGYDIAAHYVAAEYQKMGLKPGAGSSYFQTVPFVRVDLDKAAPPRLAIGGQTFANGVDSIVGPTPLVANQNEEVEVVFVGYGLEAPQFGLNDYEGLDVRGKVVAYLYGTPAGVPSEEGATLNANRSKLAASKGAIGTVLLFTPSVEKLISWKDLGASTAEGSLRWVEPNGTPHIENPTLRVGGVLGPKAATALLAGSPMDWPTLLKTIENKTAKPKGFAVGKKLRIQRKSTIKKINSANVVGMIPGNDPALANEVVMLSAHLDHDGIVPPVNGDNIKNGLMDNAAGVGTMLEAARAFQASGQAPKRSIMFVGLTAEEDGLLGSDYLAHHPAMSGKKVVANVNLDMPVLTYDFVDVVAFGAEHSTMGPIVKRAVESIGVKLSPDPVPEEGLFTRSDHYSFVKKGIPAVFLVTGYGGEGKAKVEEFQKLHYHKVSDDMKLPVRWDVGAKFARVNYVIARELADSPQAPLWYKDNFFGDRFAPNAPKAPKP